MATALGETEINTFLRACENGDLKYVKECIEIKHTIQGDPLQRVSFSLKGKKILNHLHHFLSIRCQKRIFNLSYIQYISHY